MLAQNSDILDKADVIQAVKEAVRDMVFHAMAVPDEEVVGLVLSDGLTLQLHNEHEDPLNYMTVSPEQMAPLLNLDVVAIYHSHPNGPEYPSTVDEDGLAPFPAVILTPTSAILWWWAERDKEKSFYYRIWDHHYGIE